MKRLVIARVVLILGWLALLASMPMIIYYYPNSPWKNSPQIIYQSTWAMIYEHISTINQSVQLIPYFFSLAAATLATLMPSRFVGKRLVWNCRIIVAVWICVMGLAFGLSLLLSNYVIGRHGIGYPFFLVGNMFICISVWIRPIIPKISNKDATN